jgi:hypothetical protein
MNDNSIKKILILAANPRDSDRLSLDREIEEIRTILNSSDPEARFRIEHRGSVRRKDLLQYIHDVKPWIVHFSGHGVDGTTTSDPLYGRKFTAVNDNNTQEGLIFEDDNGQSQLVSGDLLAELFEPFSNSVECVVLNSCYSLKQAKEIVKYIPYVICTNQSIGDIDAQNFSKGFYRAIKDNRSIEEAFELGKLEIKLNNGISKDLKFELLRCSKAPNDSRSLIDPNLEEPEEVVDLHSPFYIERPPVESRCYKAIAKRGALIRIRAPRQMGKSSLMIRVLDLAKQQLKYKTVNLNFQSADKSSFADLDTFLYWFCASIGQQLELPENIDDYWNKKIFDSKRKCINFFQSYLLKTIDCPIVLALDDVDRVFHYPAIARDFFGLLRSWHESAKSELIWEKLRLIVVHSQEDYSSLDIDQSPFNVGVSIKLLAFNRLQMEELVLKHQLVFNKPDLDKIIELLGGHPYLIRVALYHLKYQLISLDKLLQTASTESGLFTGHLRRHLKYLNNKPSLSTAMKEVVSAENPIRLADNLIFKLNSMGLIILQGNNVIPSCNLYKDYFCDRLKL